MVPRRVQMPAPYGQDRLAQIHQRAVHVVWAGRR
jgi:hypothetical protein